MFHGAFAEKKDAVAKERKTKGAWIKGTPTKHGYRWIVMSPRTNPIKRKKKVKPAPNPMDLMVMGANPEPQEIVARPGQTITIRVNPTPLSASSDDSQYMRQAAQELFGKPLDQLSARELSQVAMRAANLKLEKMRGNSLGHFFGFSPSPRATKSERATHRREHTARVRQVAKEMRGEYKRMRQSARATFHGKKRLETLFHEVYGRDNPQDICGAMIGGYPCSRKPGHRGPHLPQGATLRPRSRHHWGPRGNPAAEALRERFTGMEVDRIDTFREPHMPAGNYALLGKLLALYVKPPSGGQVQVIKCTGTQVVSDESARQLWFVGGDQDVSAALAMFGAVDRGAGLFELGEARRIDYKQRKEHVPDPDVDEWRHEFGEETGVRPKVWFDPKTKRLLLEGGEYVVRAEGIVN